MCLPNFMKFCHCLFKILKNQNVEDGRTDGWTDVKTVYPPRNTVCRGYKNLFVFIFFNALFTTLHPHLSEQNMDNSFSK